MSKTSHHKSVFKYSAESLKKHKEVNTLISQYSQYLSMYFCKVSRVYQLIIEEDKIIYQTSFDDSSLKNREQIERSYTEIIDQLLLIGQKLSELSQHIADITEVNHVHETKSNQNG